MSLLDRIQAANADRRADGLPRKYAAMTESPFRFFRATPFLFHQDWQTANAFDGHPLAWTCADLHLENVGSFRAENGLVYFDINDFDEGLLAPCTVDPARLITSLFVAGSSLRHTPETLRHLAGRFLDTYRQTLRQGKPRSVERETANGVLKRFLNQVAGRSRRELVKQHTHGSGHKRRLRLDRVHLLPLAPDERDRVTDWLANDLTARHDYRLHDVAFRIAGTSSLALSRYVALVSTRAGKYRLIDVKATRPSVAAPSVNARQPEWPSEAMRVVTVQQRLQDVSPADLYALTDPSGESFVVRALQPQADRLDLTAKAVRPARKLADLLDTMAQLTASAHLRSSGRQGSANADALLAFAEEPAWTDALLHQAEAYAHQVGQDYATFRAAQRRP